MAASKRTRFSRRVPDHVTDELVVVLTTQQEFLPFNEIFGLVYENLKKKNAVSGGEEMLRLRAYEKLQNLVSRGMIAKEGRTYKGLSGLEQASSEKVAERAEAAAAKRKAARTAEARRIREEAEAEAEAAQADSGE